MQGRGESGSILRLEVRKDLILTILIEQHLHLDKSFGLVLKDVQEQIALFSESTISGIIEPIDLFMLERFKRSPRDMLDTITGTKYIYDFYTFLCGLSPQDRILIEVDLDMLSEVGLNREFDGCKLSDRVEDLFFLCRVCYTLELLINLFIGLGWEVVLGTVAQVINELGRSHEVAAD